MALKVDWGALGNAIGTQNRIGTQEWGNLLSGVPLSRGSGSGTTSTASSSGGISTGGSSGSGSTSSGRSSGGGSAVSSSGWGCPSGATLIREPGTSNLVCRWDHNGALFAAQPKGAAVTPAAPTPAVPTPATPTPAVPTVPVTVGGTPPATTSQWLQAAADTFASDPQAMLATMLQDQYGKNGGNSMYGMLEPYADAINALFLAQKGTSLESGSKENQLQYMDDYWEALQTPRARIDTAGALKNIFNAPEGSPLKQYLTVGDPKEQANNTLNLIAGAVQTGYNPLFANAVMERLRLERDRYLGASGKGAVGSFIEYLNANAPDLVASIPR